MRSSPLVRLLRLDRLHLPSLPRTIKTSHLEIKHDLDPIRDVNPTFLNDLISVNKFTPLFVHRPATAMEGCLHALRDWMIDEIDTLTSVPAVVMVALTMAAPLMVR
jgi:hypothetical protein